MNRAQALWPLGNGCYAWRTDVQSPTSVLAYELLTPGRQPTHEDGAKRSRQNLSLEDHVLNVLRTATAACERLHLAEVRERIAIYGATEIPRETVKTVLQRMCFKKVIRMQGANRGAVYWVEEEKGCITES